MQQQTPQEPIRLPSPPSQRAHRQRPPQGMPPQVTPPPVPPVGGQWIWHPNPGQPLQPSQPQLRPLHERIRPTVKPIAIAMLAVALILVLYAGGPFFVLASLLMIVALILVCLL